MRPASQARMKRLLVWTLVSACLFGVVPFTASAQVDPADPAAQRAAERVARDEERAQRAQQRADERRQRADERAQRRANRQFGDSDGAHILVGQDYELAEGSSTTETVVVIGGNATINGHAQDDVVVLGGSVRLGPKAVVDGDVNLVGGALDRDPASQVAGDVHVTHVSLPWGWGWSWPVFAIPNLNGLWWQGLALTFTIGRFALVLVLSMLMVVVAPRWTAGIATRLVSTPGVSLVAGFAGEILFAPALVCLAVALIITVVGILLLAGLPLVIAAFALLWVGGYAVVAGLLGARLRGTDWYVHGLRPVDVFIGSCILSSVSVVGQVLMLSPGWFAPLALFVRGTGWMIEYAAWTVGLGAALLAWLRPRHNDFNRGSLPPVVPPLPSPSPSAL
jgi:hypothetical protein